MEDIYNGKSKSWQSNVLTANQEVWGIYAHLRMAGHIRGVGEDYVAINGSTDGDDKSGWNVTVGDVNGDGIYDLIIGVPFNNSADGSKIDCGAVYIFFGYLGINKDRFKDTFVDANVTIYGSNAGDYFGWSLSSHGDVNGDGIDDIIIGAPGNDTSNESTTLTDCGRAYIFFGRNTWLSSYSDKDADVTIVGEQKGEKLGYSVAILGDMDGKGGNETGMGGPYYDSSSLINCGKVYVFKNRSSWNSMYNSSECDSSWIGELNYSLFGFSIANAGDFNKDGYYDCVIGSPNADRAYIYYGSLGLVPQQYDVILTNKTDFETQALHRLQVNYPETEGNDYGKAENANVSLVNLAGGTVGKTVPNDGLPSNVDGVPDFYDTQNSTGSIVDTVVNDSYYWNIKEAKGYQNNSVTSEENVKGTVSPTTNAYQQTWESDDSYESIQEESELCVIWKDDFETDKGWVIEDATNPGGWERAIPQGLGGDYSDSVGNPDPSTAHSGSYVLGTDLTNDGNYSNNLAKTYNITSPAIDCSGYSQVVLTFWFYLNVEPNAYDNAYVFVSNDSVNWVTIFHNPDGYYVDNSWQFAMFDISSVAANQNTVYIRFGIGPTDSSVMASGGILMTLS